MDKKTEDEIFESLIMELRRGMIVIAVLSQLMEPRYGYSLVTLLKEKGLEVDPGTLYPLLRRLEKQDILLSSWDTEGTKPRKYYQVSSDGLRLYERLTGQWEQLVHSMNIFIKK